MSATPINPNLDANLDADLAWLSGAAPSARAITFFERIAKPLIERGWKVAPCYPKDKQVHAKLVPEPLVQMSNQFSQITKWGASEPNANVCVYAVQEEDGLCFLDKDGERDIRNAYKEDTGRDFSTLGVESSPGRGHWYFLQTQKTRALAANISEKKTNGWFSFRVKNEYVCSIGSIHPKTGQPYKIVNDVPPIPIPDALVDWLYKQTGTQTKKKNIPSPSQKIPIGQRYPSLISEVGLLWSRGYPREAVISGGLQWARANFELEGEFDEAMVRKEIEAIPNTYAPGGAKAATAYTQPPTKAAQPKTQIEVPAQEATVHLADAGIKDMPELVLDGWLGQICKSRMLEHFPVAYAWTALVTVASALVPVDPTRPGMRCNLYGCPVGPIHSGKTEAITHAKRLLDIQSPPLLDLMAGSAEMLTSAVAEANGRPRLYSTDELGHLLEKAQIQNSSFVYLLNRAFYETGFQVRSMQRRNEVRFNATLSIIGGVVDERFGDLFTAKTTGGFYDRFLYGLCPTDFRYFYVPFEGGPALHFNHTDAVASDEAIMPFDAVGNQPIPVVLDPSVYHEANRWMRDDDVLKHPDCGRIVEIAMRVATICASFDQRPVLYGKDLGPAYELARYQARIRGLLKPNAGRTFEGQLYHKFFEFLTMHTSDGSWMTRRDLFRGTSSHEIGLSVANKTLDIMIANGDVEQRSEPTGGRPKTLVRISAVPLLTHASL